MLLVPEWTVIVRLRAPNCAIPSPTSTAAASHLRRRARVTIELYSCYGAHGGDGGIRTLDRALQPYNGLANRRLQPLGHVSALGNRDVLSTVHYVPRDMPEQGRYGKASATGFGAVGF